MRKLVLLLKLGFPYSRFAGDMHRFLAFCPVAVTGRNEAR